MSDKMLSSGPAPGTGHRSPRTFTRAEIAAARRLDLVHGSESRDELGGGLFWATGDYWPNAVRATLADFELVLAAMDREWPKPW